MSIHSPAWNPNAAAPSSQYSANAGPIPRSGSGAPVWPIGTVDSLAHDDQYVVLAIARRDRYAGIGTDLEPDDHDRELREEVLRDDDPII